MEKDQDRVIRVRMIFDGWVQGVGFRCSASWAANECGLTGWVRNEPAGTVCCEVQGTRLRIDEVIRKLTASRCQDLMDLDETEIPVVADEKHFRILHC